MSVLEGIEIRLHQVALYNSIYPSRQRVTFCNQHMYGVSAACNPTLRLRRRGHDGLVEPYLSSFDRICHMADGGSDAGMSRGRSTCYTSIPPPGAKLSVILIPDDGVRKGFESSGTYARRSLGVG